MAENAITIIKRKKKGGGHGHHGGAWKVAYADFVTAMMAFFLLLWLLSSASDDTKKGIADYFDQRIPIIQSSGGGDGAFMGDSLIAKQDLAHSGRETPPAPAPPAGQSEGGADGAGQGEAEAETRALQEIESAFKALSGESEAANHMLSHIRTRLTPEGLVIELFDKDGEPLFEEGSSRPTPMFEALVSVVASVARLVTNDIALTGHTDASPDRPGQEEFGWPLSSDRAHAARRLLGASGLPARRVASVTGRAASQPIVEDPADPRNRRVEITLLRRNPLN